MKYELLSAAAPFLLQTLVNERLSEGWQLFGSPFAAASGKIAKSAGDATYCQAVTFSEPHKASGFRQNKAVKK